MEGCVEWVNETSYLFVNEEQEICSDPIRRLENKYIYGIERSQDIFCPHLFITALSTIVFPALQHYNPLAFRIPDSKCSAVLHSYPVLLSSIAFLACEEILSLIPTVFCGDFFFFFYVRTYQKEKKIYSCTLQFHIHS